jgi:activator of 2-hydroxyglutaryl-CoA dehydratase
VAKNSGVVAFMEEKLGGPIHVYEEPQIVGALGAALHALRH